MYSVEKDFDVVPPMDWGNRLAQQQPHVNDRLARLEQMVARLTDLELERHHAQLRMANKLEAIWAKFVEQPAP